MLRGYDLLHYVESLTVLKDDLMICQDELLLSWIFSSLTLVVLLEVVICETSAQVWSTLVEIYASTSNSHIL